MKKNIVAVEEGAHPGKWTGTKNIEEDKILLESGEALQCKKCREIIPKRLVFNEKCPNCEAKIS